MTLSSHKARQVELLAPVGSFSSLQAAISSGASSVYFGIKQLNMREKSSENFTLKDLKKISALCQEKGIKTYLTLNVLIYDNDLSRVKTICESAKEANLTAVIATDFATIACAREVGLPIHLSTQANVSNREAVRFYSTYADVIVLARELSLKQIQSICSFIRKEKILGPSGKPLRIELFAHGALCMAIAGKCHMSLALHNASANRGQCLQVCRRQFRIFEENSQEELCIENRYVLSPKDLCTISFLEPLVQSGVSILKIEGRGRSPEYVKTVVTCYREALDSLANGSYNATKIELWLKKLEQVYHRGFWHGGYYLGHRLGEWSGTYGSQATAKKTYIGRVTRYFSRIQVAECKIEAGSLKEGDSLWIIGPTTGVLEHRLTQLRTHQPTPLVEKGALCTFPLEKKIRKNDEIYRIESVSQ